MVGGLSKKNVNHMVGQQLKILKLYCLKWSKTIPKKKFGTEDKGSENSYLKLSISFRYFGRNSQTNKV